MSAKFPRGGGANPFSAIRLRGKSEQSQSWAMFDHKNVWLAKYKVNLDQILLMGSLVLANIVCDFR